MSSEHEIVRSSFDVYEGEVVRIVCPLCECDFIHGRSVLSFDRDEDDPQTTMTVVERGAVIMTMIDSKENPSSRRDAVEVRFSCEWGHSFGIQFSQHKGTTLVGVVTYKMDEK